MGRSIQGMYDNFKRLLSDDVFFYTALIVLISIISFGLGRYSMATNMSKLKVPLLQEATVVKKVPLTSEPTQSMSTSSTPVVVSQVQSEKRFVASKKGTKYHLLTCPGAQQIKETNKIFFSSKEEALKAGYSPSSNCKGI